MESNVIAFPGLGLSFNPSRVAFSVLGKDIYWYGIIIAVGFLLGLTYAVWRAKKEKMDIDAMLDVVLWTTPVALVCARLYYVIFYPSLYHSLYDVIAVWHGGLAIYGGIIGAFLFGTWMCRRKKVPLFKMFDLVALGFMIGQCIGRWGNFINREAFGSTTSLPWGMEITVDGQRTMVHPTFLYESLWNLIGFLLLHKYYDKRKYDGEVALLYAVWYGFGRFFIEGLRTDSLYFFGTGLRVSQLVAALSVVAGLALLIWLRRRLTQGKGLPWEKWEPALAAQPVEEQPAQPEIQRERSALEQLADEMEQAEREAQQADQSKEES
ncbi:MAG: prolipoprotein diacylglyceryl transferase [Eubacteriales bacterium]|jgi:phosphatidylglycerol:prolipoprotein diacylglycerol transferase